MRIAIGLWLGLICLVCTAWAQPALDLSAEERAFIAAHPVVRAGLHGESQPPQYTWRTDGTLDGVAGEYLRRVSAMSGIRFELQPFPTFEDSVQAARERQVDVLPYVLNTGDMAGFLRFSEPYFIAPGVFITRRELTDFSRTNQFGGLPIAAVSGSTGLRHLQQQYPQARIVEYPSAADALRAVSTGSADIYLGHLPNAVYEIERQALANLLVRDHEPPLQANFRFGVRSDWAVLQSIVNKALAAIDETERRAIAEKWLPVRAVLGEDLRSLSLNQAERDWLSAHRQLRLGYDAHFAPFTFEESGEMRGMGADYIREAARRLGLEIVEQRAGTWAQTLAAAEAGEIDVVVALARNEERRQRFQFVGPWVRGATAIITAPNNNGPLFLSEFSGKTLALLESHFLIPRLQRQYPGITLLFTPSVEAALRAVAEGRAAGALANLQVSSALIRERFPGQLSVTGSVPNGESELFFGVPNGREQFAVVLRKAIDSMSEAEHNQMRSRWLNVEYRPGIRRADLIRWGVPLGSAALLVMGFLAWGNRRLKREVVARSAAEAEALRASRAKSQFLATVSHEVRTPMSGVLGTADALSREGLNARQATMVDTIRSSAVHLLELLNHTLEFAHSEAGAITLHLRPIPVRLLLEQGVSAFRAEAERRGLRLVVEVDDDVPAWLLLDTVRSRQVVANLVGNAVKFTEHGQVTVTLGIGEPPADWRGPPSKTPLTWRWLVLEVADTGCGVASDDLDKLFRPFSQVGEDSAQRAKGSGLGLAIVRQIVEAAYGRVRAESTVGAGSRFVMEMPVREASNQVAPASLVQGREALAGLTALIVDDDHVALMVHAEVLRQFGFGVATADSGDEAWIRWRELRPNLLFTDWSMPGLGGEALTRRIRLTEAADAANTDADRPKPSHATIVVAATGLSLPEEIERCRAAGADAHLPKPFTVEDVQLWWITDQVQELLPVRTVLVDAAQPII